MSVNVTKDGGVIKQVLREGTGPLPKKGDAVSMRLVVRVVGADGARREVYNSKERGQDFSVNMGKDETIVGLEKALETMKKDEHALVTLQPNYGYGPMGNEYGFHSMGKSIPANAVLELEVDVAKIGDADERKKRDQQNWDHPLRERVEKANRLKEQGNQVFSRKDFRSACELYKEALEITERVGDASDEEKAHRTALRVTLSLNVAQCLIMEKLYVEASLFVGNALRDEPNNPKGLYRMAVCLQQQHKIDEALEYANKARVAHDGKEVRQLLVELKEMKKQEDSKASVTYANIFKGDAAPVYDAAYVEQQRAEAASKKQDEDTFTQCQVCGERLEKIQLARHIIKRHGDQKPKDFSALDYSASIMRMAAPSSMK